MTYFKEGQKVKVKSRIKVGNIYNDALFTRTMGMLKGQIVTIKNVIETGKYRIKEDNGNCVWTDDMFVKRLFEKPFEDIVKEKNFTIGAKVTHKHYGEGIVIDKKNSGENRENIGVEFVESMGGHTCQGKGKNNHCWYCREDDLEILENDEEEKTENVIIDLEKESSESIKELSSAVKELSKKIEKEDPLRKAMIEAIIDKGKELATEDLRKEIKEDLDKFIADTYGALPKKIVIEKDNKKIEIEGIFHKDFEKICRIVERDVPLMLVGGAGAGKNYTLEQVAKALGLTFYTTNAVNQDYKLTGFIDANGKYHETEFYKAFVNGGIFFLDEIDASCPEALVTLNSAIANKYFDFPTGRVVANKNFRVVCAGNTYGTGADMVYVGRNVLDGATLDRFVVLEFDYDEEVERKLSYDEDLFNFIRDLRRAVNRSGLRYIVSMRAIINSSKLLEIGIDKDTILRTTIIKNMQKDDLNTIIEKLETRNDWYNAIKRLCD